MEQFPANLVVQFPMRVVVALVEIAERAPMHEAERLWLEEFKSQVAKSVAKSLEEAKTPEGEESNP